MERGIACFAPLTGFAAALLGIAAFALALTWADDPETDAAGAEVALWMTENTWEILVTRWLWLLGVAAFLWFLGSLRAVLGPAEGADRRVTSIAFAAGVVFAVMAALFVAPVIAGAGASEFDDRTITPETAEVLWVAGNGVWIPAEVAAGVLALAVATVVLRTGVLPKWYGWVGLLYGLWLLIFPIAFIAFMGLPIWLLVTAALVWMVSSKSRAQAMPTTA